MRKIFVIICVFELILCSCGKRQTNSQNSTAIDSTQIKKSIQDSINNANTPDTVLLKNVSREVIHSIKQRDYEILITYFHPTVGVRFSPYAYIDTMDNIKLDADEFKKYCLGNRDKKIKWGTIDPTGDPILMSVPEYLQTWVYRNDFENAPSMSLNNCKAGGTTINNLEEVYKGCEYIEYYFPGFDPDFDGMDWQALRLVYRKYKGSYYLVGIINDEWTI